jgi:hypothetical protein
VLVPGFGALAQPGQPYLQAPPGSVVAKFCGQAHRSHVILPRHQARQLFPVTSNKFAELVQVLVTFQPLSHLMQGAVTPAGSASAELIEVVTGSQPARAVPRPGRAMEPDRPNPR